MRLYMDGTPYSSFRQFLHTKGITASWVKKEHERIPVLKDKTGEVVSTGEAVIISDHLSGIDLWNALAVAQEDLAAEWCMDLVEKGEVDTYIAL